MGLLDLGGALFLLLFQLGIFNEFFRPLIIIAFYLIGKGILFKGDFASIVDFFSGVYFILAFLGIRTFVSFIIVLFLFQKAYFSLKF